MMCVALVACGGAIEERRTLPAASITTHGVGGRFSLSLSSLLLLFFFFFSIETGLMFRREPTSRLRVGSIRTAVLTPGLSTPVDGV